MSKRSMKVKSVSFYDQQKAIWEEWKRSDGRNRLEWGPPEGNISAQDFLAQLQFLALVTGDKIFREARLALYEHDLFDKSGNWKRGLMPELARELREIYYDRIFVYVEACILTAKSKRTAFAEIAALLSVPANSFDAAVKRVERIWDSRKAAGYTAEDLLERAASEEMDVPTFIKFARFLEVLGASELIDKILQDGTGELSNHTE